MNQFKNTTLRAMIYKILILLSLGWQSSSESATSSCRNPSTVADFDINKFTNGWYTAARDMSNRADIDFFGQATCAKVNVFVDNPPNFLNINLLIGGVSPNVSGPYTTISSNKSKLKFYYTARKTYYDFSVVCTDYTSYAVTYLCGYLSDNTKTEFTLLIVRDVKEYDTIKNSAEFRRCVALVTDTLVDDIIRVEHNNCTNYN
uniref:Lipocalin/cytosolic fatty-acid binding domain-containing protein n=1 Tax=Clastoptera arizonana TaxID=38151 RepID=A0A1B6CM25_9HEMI